MSMRAVAFSEHVVASLWFVPMLFAIAAFAVSRSTVAIDLAFDLDHAPHALLPGDAEALSSTAATVAAAMLTFLGFVFTTTLVAVQLASSQYSPRIVRLFVRSRLTQTTLGVFIASFVFAINTLVAIRGSRNEEVPTLTMSITYLLVLATLVMFVVFVHGMVRLLRVQHLVRITARASHGAIDAAFPPADAYVEAEAPRPADGARHVLHRTGAAGNHDVARVLQAVDVGGLAAVAARHDCWIEIGVAVGEHVGVRTTLARVHGVGSSGPTEDEIRSHLLFGHERTLVQDPAFGIRQLVDIASRALSPAVNDPTTAVQSLLRIVDLLERVADRPDPSGWYTDAAGVVRVRLVEPDFERLARLGVTEVLLYGAGAPQVTRCLSAAYDELERSVSAERSVLVGELRTELDAVAAEGLPTAFVRQAVVADRMGLG